MTYFYSAYQLTIQSDLLFPELHPIEQNLDSSPDVIIRLGSVPRSLDAPTKQGVVYQTSPNQFLLNLDTVARYLVQNGEEIRIEVVAETTEDDVRLFVLGPCIGALLHQRGILAFHAATMATKYGAVLLTGPSGMGKSTLLSEFLRRDYAMMADDITGIVLDKQETPVVLPAFPRSRLWADAAQQLAYDVTKLSPTRPGLEKYELHLSTQFATDPTPIHRIYRLNINHHDELSITPIAPIWNFQNILRNTYRQKYLDGLAMRETHFGLISTVAKSATMQEVTRPSQGFRLRELADLIEQDFTV